LNKKRKICVITGTRGDYGLLFWVMKKISDTEELELQIIATGMHLSAEFGFTFKQIEDDGFSIDYKVEMLLSSDTSIGISKSMGLGMIGFADAYVKLLPDLLIVLGDRFEIFSAVSAATIARIPVAHLSGGETTEGAFDESFRHSITKMSHLHFVTTEQYRNRVIQLGEQPNLVFNVGAFGLDNLLKLELLSKDNFEKSINFELGKKNILITFHPVTLENATAKQQFSNLLRVLEEFENIHYIFTKTNADTGGRIINQMIDDYVNANYQKAVCFISLGQLRYLSAIQHVDAVVGNSSSGLVEAPYFRVPTINIGDRQKGRIKPSTVIDCEASVVAIRKAFDVVFSKGFDQYSKDIENPFLKGGAAERVVDIVKTFPLNNILKKSFYDFKVPK
jgi:GDP/UDP-N,N'-diacetylbacillosamine 2-epimerase (hydrolysing)